MTSGQTSSATVNKGATRFSRPRFALVLSFSVYPLITVLLYLIFPITDGWALWQRTLVLVPIMVASMIWGLIPLVQSRFRGFLNPAARAGCPR